MLDASDHDVARAHDQDREALVDDGRAVDGDTLETEVLVGGVREDRVGCRSGADELSEVAARPPPAVHRGERDLEAESEVTDRGSVDRVVVPLEEDREILGLLQFEQQDAGADGVQLTRGLSLIHI